MSNSVDTVIKSHRLLPVIEIQDAAKQAVALGRALISGGLPVAEVTFRSKAAPEAIRLMSELPELCVGAGTIINVEQAQLAISCGAKFLVSPGCFPKVIAFAKDKGIPIFPGVATPTDIGTALEAGLEVLKFFPAEAYGGLNTLKALCGPFPQVRFVPTGGISEKNLAAYLAHPKVLACGGSWMVEKSLLAAGKWDEVRVRVAAAVALVKSCQAPAA
jgi:2-dehydro-3-deoxyphosphogluconate aldolase/(4S)-4-hydroxy-2-oxoglutarate aldolase